MFSIGEFSKIVGLTIKTLRHYHDIRLLEPSYVDETNGYRFYGTEKIEVALAIKTLRDLEFSLPDIAEIIRDHPNEQDLLDYLQRQQTVIRNKLAKYEQIDASLIQLINSLSEVRNLMLDTTFKIEEKVLEPVLIAGFRMRGKYSECGKGFGRIGRRFGRHICGKPMLLIYDSEFRDEDADFEACMPVREGDSRDEISVRELAGGRCVSLLHLGPYEECGRTYEKLFTYINEKGYEVTTPCREVYIKGPGMIFKGNPKKYLTEIQLLITDGTD